MKIFAFGIFILLYYCIRTIFVLPQNFKFYVAFLDVGQGDSFIINIPRYGQVLLDTGINYQSSYLSARNYIFPVCQVKSVFVTHYDKDHSGGLDRIARFCKGVRVYDNLSKSDFLKISDVSFYILSPPHKDTLHEENDDSLVILLKRGDFDVLFTGDAGLDVLEGILLDVPPGLDVYKVSHHGSSHNNSFQLVDWLKPTYCIISVGKNNYGHPSDEVLNGLEKVGCKTYRTDRDGTIMVY